MTTHSTKSIKVEVSDSNGWRIFAFDGFIDETFASLIEPLSKEISAGYLLDCRKVSNINSCGVAEWSGLLDKLKVNGKVIFDRCPPQIISVLNIISTLLDGAYVRSFYRTFVCSQDHETLVLFAIDLKNPEAQPRFEKKDTCPKCSMPIEPMMELDEECPFIEILKPMK